MGFELQIKFLIWLVHNSQIALYYRMPKKKVNSKTQKRIPNVDMDYSQQEDIKQPKTDLKVSSKETFCSIQIRRAKALQIIGGNQLPKKFNFRQEEIKQITSYIDDCFQNKNKNKYKILMITGSPGAGKTLSVTYILNKMTQKVKIIRFNANIIKTVRDVQEIICDKMLEIKLGNKLSTAQIIRYLEQKKSTTKFIIYIQEIQIILQQKTNIFSQDFFCLFSNPKLNIMLLGISNTIDAMIKYSKSISLNLTQIKNIVFKPYNPQAMINIIQQKLTEIEEITGFKIIISQKIMKNIAAKMENLKKGDIRKVLEFLKELTSKILPKDKTECIGVQQEGYVVTLSIVHEIFANMKPQKNDIIENLPRNPQLVLIAIYTYIKNKDSLFTTLKQLYKQAKWVYESCSLGFQFHFVDDSLEQLIQYSLISRANKNKVDRIMLKISMSEMEASWRDHNVFGKFFV